MTIYLIKIYYETNMNSFMLNSQIGMNKIHREFSFAEPFGVHTTIEN